MTSLALNNRLGKTALWVHLSGVVVGGAMMGTAALLTPNGDEPAIVGGVGMVIFLVMLGWSIVLAARGFGSGERALLPFMILVAATLEVSGLIIGAGYFTAKHQVENQDSLPFINAWALPVFIPVSLLSLVFAISLCKYIAHRKSTVLSWRFVGLSFCVILILLLPFPLLKFCAKLQRAKWQGDLAERSLYFSPTLFEEVMPADEFMSKRYFEYTYAAFEKATPEQYLQALRFTCRSKNSKLRILMSDILRQDYLTPDVQEEVFLSFSQAPENWLRIQSFQVYLSFNRSEIEAYIQKKSPKIATQLLRMTQDPDPSINRSAAVVLARFLDERTHYIFNSKNPIYIKSKRTYLMSPLDADETVELEALREKTEAWLKEHP